MSDNLFQERLRELESGVEEGKIYPKTIAATKALSSKLAKQDKAYAEWLQKQKEKKEKEQVKEGEKHSVPDTEREKDLAAAAHPKDKITHKDVLVKRGVLKAESVEQIEETSKEKLQRYLDRSMSAQGHLNMMRRNTQGDEKQEYARKEALRKKGISRAVSRLAPSESVEWIEAAVYEKTLTAAELKKREEVAKAMERDKPGMDKSKKMAIATAVAKRVAESMQIDELSKSTLGSYVKAAAKDAEQAGRDQEYHGHNDDYARGEKRQKGIAKAVDRMTKEEVEQVAELSKSTLSSYRDAAKERRKEHNSAIQRASSIKDTMGDENGILDKAISYHAKEHDRLGGKMKIAARKIKKISESEVGQIDELSKDTLKAYAKKAVPDMQASQKKADDELKKASHEKNDRKAQRHYDAAMNAKNRTEKRMAGVAGAIKRVTKEDVEQVSELSKTTLASYYAKSIKDRHSKDLARDSAKRRGDEKEADALGREVTNRSSGLEKAKAKFFAEELVGESWKVSNSKASRVFAVTSKEEAVSKFTKQGHGDPTSVEKVSDDRVNPHKAMLSVAHQRTTTK